MYNGDRIGRRLGFQLILSILLGSILIVFKDTAADEVVINVRDCGKSTNQSWGVQFWCNLVVSVDAVRSDPANASSAELSVSEFDKVLGGKLRALLCSLAKLLIGEPVFAVVALHSVIEVNAVDIILTGLIWVNDTHSHSLGGLLGFSFAMLCKTHTSSDSSGLRVESAADEGTIMSWLALGMSNKGDCSCDDWCFHCLVSKLVLFLLISTKFFLLK